MPDIATQFYPIDIAIVLLILFGAIQGYVRGLSGELARLIGTLIAVLAALRFYRPIATYIAANTRAAEEMADVLAFVATLVGAILVLLLVRLVFKYLLQIIVNERFDKAAGLFAGMLRMALFTTALLIALMLWPNESLNATVKEQSIAGAAVVKVLPHVEKLIGAASEHLPGKEAPTEPDGDTPDSEPDPKPQDEAPSDAT